MRLAVLCDGRTLARWQLEALRQVADRHQLFLLKVAEPPPPPRRLAHAAYYLLNLLAIRNRQSRRVPFPAGWSGDIAGTFCCEPLVEGHWAALPESALAWLKAQRIDAVIKFGLGLLRVPPEDELGIPILSYHHGDPSRYRGRPAGFYELADGAERLGQIVQCLANRLDSGPVLAFAETRGVKHSYRSTLVDSYRLSPHLLPRALDALARAAGSTGRRPAG